MTTMPINGYTPDGYEATVDTTFGGEPRIPRIVFTSRDVGSTAGPTAVNQEVVDVIDAAITATINAIMTAHPTWATSVSKSFTGFHGA